MKKLQLDNVTLLMIDCLDMSKSLMVFNHCMQLGNFAAAKLLTHFEYVDSNRLFKSPSNSAEVNNNLQVPPQIIKIDPITSKQAYSAFVVKQLAKYLDSDFVLVIQTDGFIVNPGAWLPEFLEYDYIGAPWPPNQAYFGNPNHLVGNGGFSLRSKKLCDFLAQSPIVTDTHPEDVQICQKYRPYLERMGFKFAPIELAHKFSTEQYIWNNSFGHHDYFSLDPMFLRRRLHATD